MDLPQRKNVRKSWYNYNSTGSYFITMCTKNRKHYFWEIKNKEMILNDIWKYAWHCRTDIPNHFPFVEIWAFICMPDHIHGILTINENQTNHTDRNTAHSNNKNQTDRIIRERSPESIDSDSSDRTKNISSQPCAVSWSVGSIIRGFKIGITKFARQNSIPFERQSSFYDHIIRNEIEYFFMEQYIRNNPKNRWIKKNK